MEYFASIKSNIGENSLPYNPCKLLDFELIKLTQMRTHLDRTKDREILAVILGGKAAFRVGSTSFNDVGGRANVFAGKPHAVYLPADTAFKITAKTDLEVALVSAPSDLETKPYVITPDQVTNGVWGAANFKRYFHQILTATGQPDLPARRLIVGETFTPSGNWSTYPPHKHEKDDLPNQACHEEMYYFKVSPADGFGICRYYTKRGLEENYTVRDNTILMAPNGYHTVVSAPGYMTYYLWFLAGEHRTQATVSDPTLSWVGRATPMLKELGH